MRKRDAGLGVIDDGSAYSLTTGPPPAVGPVEVPDDVPYSMRLGHKAGGVEADQVGALDQNSGTPGIGGASHAVYEPGKDPEAFLPRYFTRGKDGAPANDVPALTKESDRGDGMAVVHEPGEEQRTGEGEIAPTLRANGATGSGGRVDKHPMVVEDEGATAFHATQEPITGEGFAPAIGRTSLTGVHQRGVAGTVRSHARPGSNTSTDVLDVSPGDRALLERLERDGFVPAVPFDPKPDGPRYAAMGDAVTVNVAEWIGRRLVAALRRGG